MSDDKKAISSTPYDEVTWAAGTVVGIARPTITNYA